MTTTPPRIDPRLGAAALRAPAASKVDYRPQAILKFHRPSSLDYIARQGLPVKFGKTFSGPYIIIIFTK